eukprot:GHVP01061224.1.p1 GENE.GHVP01061224.1~~GHVP01061224.1.p1  ORF type:complete len:320 (-),score=10.18 GHVP01061224.1:77-1036(-)
MGGSEGYELTETFYERGDWFQPWKYPETVPFNLINKYPWLKWLHLRQEYECKYGYLLLAITRTGVWFVPIITFLYLALIYYGPKFMEKRKAFDLRNPLKYWNLFLAVFSIIGTIRTVPHFLLFLWNYGFESSVCSPPIFTIGGEGPAGLWVLLFNFSKTFELIDTVFIILRKRKVTLLHWYHHCTVLLYTWYGFGTEFPLGVYFCLMNYVVHSIMYTYYFLAAHYKTALKGGQIVTILQIAQMFAGIALTVTACYYALKYDFPTMVESATFSDISRWGCYLDKNCLVFGCIIYTTYLLLFLNFFKNRYLSPKNPIRKKE